MERKIKHKFLKNNPDVVYGIRAVEEAIKSGRGINKVLVQKGLKGELFKDFWSLMKNHNIVYHGVPVQKLNSITTKNHQGVIAFTSPIEYTSLELLLPSIYEKGEQPFLLILDRITDVRNLGAIARSAECHGVHGIVLPSKGSALVGSDAIKTSAGALNKLPVCKENNLKQVIQFLKDSGLSIIGCSEKGSSNVYDVDLTGPTAILMGSEEDGISPAYLKLCDQLVKIPMYGTIPSLNVSVSASILMYEYKRQLNV
ncbi:MAG: 23S rRNA (guanosine(2251)-2'-O)-methyltransferase RlmB [Flavobacteriales bacterium]|nr:23S rRNA (guanosine(2251)-2'-O)-methyltransferase RlmB [Flavobacteriales bacterium]|tara:strand:- start:20906 stop:21673 length:768 start_codon:yes stop_codon:yes gene_type:complete